MKNFPWNEFLQRHPIFATVRDEKRIDVLLADETSWERVYPEHHLILRQHEVGDSVFIIGDGSAEAVLEVGDATILLSVLRRGDVFGEMALLERRARSATVRTKGPCTILEIRGADFMDLMVEYPDIEFKLLVKMSERLRNTGERVIGLQAGTIDDKLNIFKLKLDTEQRLVEAHVKAAQTMFDQTKLRADEVIISAERSRDRLHKTGAVIGAFATVILGLLGAFGFKQVWDMSQIANEMRAVSKEVSAKRDDALNASGDIIARSTQIRETHDKVMPLAASIDDIKAQLAEVTRENFLVGVFAGKFVEARRDYLKLRTLAPIHGEVLTAVSALEVTLFNDAVNGDPKEALNLFDEVAKDSAQHQDKAVMVRAYFLRLAYSILTDQESRAVRQTLYTQLNDEIKKYPSAALERDKLPADVVNRLHQQQGDKAAELLSSPW